MAVVFIFLGSARATLIPLAAVPVSLIGTFAILLAMGFTLNTISLLALVLAIGTVVDDAIVVVENCDRVLSENPEMTPHPEAARQAMEEITGPVIATTLVLLSVFVPVAFIPGISGQLFQQFAVAVSVSVVISTINALTLSPALCGLVLRQRSGPPTGVLGAISRAIDTTRDGYTYVAGGIARKAVIGLVLLGAALGSAGWLFNTVPTGFLPAEDQGLFLVEMRLPDGASVNRTDAVRRDFVEQVREIEAVDNMLSASGYSILDGLVTSSSAFMAVALDPFEERTTEDKSAFSIIQQVGAKGLGVREAVVMPFNLPPIIGLGTGSGFEFQLNDLEGRAPADLAAVAGGMTVAASQDERLGTTFSTYSASTPQLYLDIDRERLQTLGVSVSDLFTTLQGTFGSLYVNDFNLFGRSWQVNLQAGEADRDEVPDLNRLHVRNQNGDMVPLPAVATYETILGPQSIIRYNNYRSVTITGEPAPGVASGTALDAMEELAANTLPSGFGFEWTGTALQEREAAGQTVAILMFSILFAYLFLVGLYESWTIPIPVLMSVAFGGSRGAWCSNDLRAFFRPLWPDRSGDFDRAGGQERNPDRRVREDATRGRHGDCRCCRRRGADTFPCRDDDRPFLCCRDHAPGICNRCGRDHPANSGHVGRWWYDRRNDRRNLRHSSAVRCLSGDPRMDKTAVWRSSAWRRRKTIVSAMRGVSAPRGRA